MARKCERTKQWTMVQLLDLARYAIEKVERWPGWGRLFLKQKRAAYPCPGCGRIRCGVSVETMAPTSRP